MTKEAKVGMLTGLAVIVLIGVLLSEYLGGPAAGAGNNVATGRMASLPLGETKRDEILQPVGVPTMARGSEASGPGAVLTQVPTAFAVEPAQSNAVAAAPAAAMPEGPLVRSPVQVVPAGPMQMVSAQGNELPPTVQLGDHPAMGAATGALLTGPATLVDGAKPAGATAEAAKPAGQTYVIAPGDSLGKIAKNFYKSNTAETRGWLTAANPSMTKDGQPYLIAGRKMVIPAAPASGGQTAGQTAGPAVAAKPAAKPVVDSKKSDDAGVVIRKPGAAVAAAGGTKADAPAKADTPAKAKAVKTYVVKSGDSLEKIAKHLDSENYRDAEKKLMAANGIKDAGSLQAGQTLKLPM